MQTEKEKFNTELKKCLLSRLDDKSLKKWQRQHIIKIIKQLNGEEITKIAKINSRDRIKTIIGKNYLILKYDYYRPFRRKIKALKLLNKEENKK